MKIRRKLVQKINKMNWVKPNVRKIRREEIIEQKNKRMQEEASKPMMKDLT